MKKIVTVSFALVILFACKSSNSGDNLSGAYVQETGHEYGKFWDTLYINKVSGDAEKMYNVEKKTKVQSLKPTQYIDHRSKHFTAMYDSKEGTLSLEPGLTYSVDLAKGILTNGQSTYKRIP